MNVMEEGWSLSRSYGNIGKCLCGLRNTQKKRGEEGKYT